MTSVLMFAALLGQDQGVAPNLTKLQEGVLAPGRVKIVPGTERSYKLEVQLTIENTDLIFTALVAQKVEAVSETGYSISSQQSNAKLTTGGNEIPYTATPKTTVSYSPLGLPQKIDGADVTGDDYRFQRLNMLIWPEKSIQLQESWMSDVKPVAGQTTSPVQARYTLLAFEPLLGRECVKIGFDIKELSGGQPAVSKGVTWVELSSGMPVKTEADMTNAPIAEQAMKAKWSLSLMTPTQ